ISLLSDIIKLHPVPDMLLTLTCDPLAWIQSLDDTLVDMSPKALVHTILALPFTKPDWMDERSVLESIQNSRTRNDMLHALIRFGHMLVLALRGESGEKGSTFEEKMNWLLKVLLDGLGGTFSLSSSIIALLNQLVADAESLESPELTAVAAQLAPLISTKAMKTGPPMAIFPDIVPPFIASFVKRKNDPVKLANAQELKFVNNLVEQDMTMASLEGIWVQLDSETDRLVMPTQVGVQEQALDETLISCAPGILDISLNAVTWSGLERDANAATAVFQPALVLHFPLIQRFSIGRVMDATALPYASHTLHTVAGNLKRDETMMIKAFYMTIFTADQTLRFYPFYDNEIYRIVDIVSNATGLTPFKEGQFVKYTVAKQLQVTRHHILDHLLQRHGHPWIDHSAELIRVLRKLTQEREPQTLYDIERLYHSCRQEVEVTKETLHHLRLIWHNSPSEAVRMKVLAIVDRLLDRSIMREGDPNFVTVYRWLRHLEETVSPYKSAESLKIILVLLQRAKAIQIDPLTPLTQVQASFDHLGEYNRFCSFF
ncbi:hypothetical protein BCR44DRAFT_110117, partial [Catenaria anguillulae PL171]